MRFNFPSDISKSDKDFIYKSLFDLTTPSISGGFIRRNVSKSIYQLQRLWIHVSGRLSQQAIQNIDTLT